MKGSKVIGKNKLLRNNIVVLLYLLFLTLIFLSTNGNYLSSTRELRGFYQSANQQLAQKARADSSLIPAEAEPKKRLRKLRAARNSALRKFDSIQEQTLQQRTHYTANNFVADGKFYSYSRIEFIKKGYGSALKGLLEHYSNTLDSLEPGAGSAHFDFEPRDINQQKVNWQQFYFDDVPLSYMTVVMGHFRNKIELAYFETMGEWKKRGWFKSGSRTSASDSVSDNSESATGNVRLQGLKKRYYLGQAVTLQIPLRDGSPAFLPFLNGQPMRMETRKDSAYFSFTPSASGKYRLSTNRPDGLELELEVLKARMDISAGTGNVFYLGRRNKLRIDHPLYSPGELIVEANHGKVTRQGRSWRITVDELRRTIIAVYRQKEGRRVLLAEREYATEKAPVPELRWPGQVDGKLPLRQLAANKLKLVNPHNGKSAYSDLQRFALELISADSTYRHQNQGTYFDSETRRILEKARPGNVLAITGETATESGLRELQPLILEIQ